MERSFSSESRTSRLGTLRGPCEIDSHSAWGDHRVHRQPRISPLLQRMVKDRSAYHLAEQKGEHEFHASLFGDSRSREICRPPLSLFDECGRGTSFNSNFA